MSQRLAMSFLHTITLFHVHSTIPKPICFPGALRVQSRTKLSQKRILPKCICYSKVVNWIVRLIYKRQYLRVSVLAFQSFHMRYSKLTTSLSSIPALPFAGIRLARKSLFTSLTLTDFSSAFARSTSGYHIKKKYIDTERKNSAREDFWVRFLYLARSKLTLCSINHRPGYWSNLPCDWPNTAWVYSEHETENRPRLCDELLMHGVRTCKFIGMISVSQENMPLRWYSILITADIVTVRLRVPETRV